MKTKLDFSLQLQQVLYSILMAKLAISHSTIGSSVVTISNLTSVRKYLKLFSQFNEKDFGIWSISLNDLLGNDICTRKYIIMSNSTIQRWFLPHRNKTFITFAIKNKIFGKCYNSLLLKTFHLWIGNWFASYVPVYRYSKSAKPSDLFLGGQLL